MTIAGEVAPPETLAAVCCLDWGVPPNGTIDRRINASFIIAESSLPAIR
jgi:hypothetical protein